MEEFGGFKVLPFKINEKSKVIRHLFMKMHLVREKCPLKPEYQTLFAVGIPEFCDHQIIKLAFRRCGKIKDIYFHKEPTPIEPETLPSKYFIPKTTLGFKVAYIVFTHTSGLENALSLDCTENNPLILSTATYQLKNITKRWCHLYNDNIISPTDVQKEIDTFMLEYDKKIEERVHAEKEADEEDVEGWKTVTKRGRNPGFARKETIKNNILKREAKKKAKKTLKNFYRFQIKESKINQLMELRNKFDNDKTKIDLLKQSRKFKPF
ncbi:ribosomal RNA-processing protein 7 homolog A [Daktulosphaira vitifoliae]|uniref:ribosomal RNA-processing protein 7 homolog A n=1 Tax=Daktulosphaira vitifoliae TaxID=58002 RepID=UPI0021A9BFDC|nr:ribosomal RNA-processing protein 7 homolog A [Daktulosphaira vitifoliae]